MTGPPAGDHTAHRRALVVAAAQPPCSAGDVRANVGAHARAIGQARARLVVFPELSLTGYVLGSTDVRPDDPDLHPLVDACVRTGTFALVGAPVADETGRRSIAVLGVDAHGIRVLYRKMFLAEEEAAQFAPGTGPAAVDVDGWRIGLGVCKDTGTADHVRATAALGVDVYAAGLVQAPDALAELDARGRRIAAACAAHVVFASAAGSAGGRYQRSLGTSSVWCSDGSLLARADRSPGEFARAILGARCTCGDAAPTT